VFYIVLLFICLHVLLYEDTSRFKYLFIVSVSPMNHHQYLVNSSMHFNTNNVYIYKQINIYHVLGGESRGKNVFITTNHVKKGNTNKNRMSLINPSYYTLHISLFRKTSKRWHFPNSIYMYMYVICRYKYIFPPGFATEYVIYINLFVDIYIVCKTVIAFIWSQHQVVKPRVMLFSLVLKHSGIHLIRRQ
jgi:hypothetical protein